MKKKLAGMLTCTFLFAGYSNVSAAPADDRDCGEFASHEEVMQFWYDNGYSASNDPHDLDRDNDGLACEVSQSEYDNFVASQETSTDQPPANESNDREAVEGEAEQGEQLPDTASNSLLMALMSAGFAGIGSLLIFSRKKKQV